MSKNLQNYVNGAWVAPADGAYIKNENPYDGTTISMIPKSTAADVGKAVMAAKAALLQPDWDGAYISARKRSMWLSQIANGIEARLEEFAQAESLDTGKPITRCRTIDIPRAVENFRYFSQVGANFHADCNPSEAGGFNYTTRRPVGVVALITPWNLPLYLLTWKVAPALMMGNTIVAKPR